MKPLFLQSAWRATMNRGDHSERKGMLRLIEPDRAPSGRDDEPDPRLVELVRLLARRAAREIYEEQMRQRRTTRS